MATYSHPGQARQTGGQKCDLDSGRRQDLKGKTLGTKYWIDKTADQECMTEGLKCHLFDGGFVEPTRGDGYIAGHPLRFHPGTITAAATRGRILLVSTRGTSHGLHARGRDPADRYLDLDGKVYRQFTAGIGIRSRSHIHVPIDTYKQNVGRCNLVTRLTTRPPELALNRSEKNRRAHEYRGRPQGFSVVKPASNPGLLFRETRWHRNQHSGRHRQITEAKGSS